MAFIPEPAILVAYTAAVLAMTVTPGPDMTFFIGRSVSQNATAGFVAFIGAACGIVVHSIFVAFGLSALIVASPALFAIIKVVGALYLGWLAIEAIRKGSAFTIANELKAPRSLLSNWLQGLAINLLNPKIILFFMTFLPQFVHVGDPYAPGKLMFLGILFILIATPLLIPMILLAARFSKWMRNNPRITRMTDYLFAGVFGAFAIRILFAERN